MLEYLGPESQADPSSEAYQKAFAESMERANAGIAYFLLVGTITEVQFDPKSGVPVLSTGSVATPEIVQSAHGCNAAVYEYQARTGNPGNAYIEWKDVLLNPDAYFLKHQDKSTSVQIGKEISRDGVSIVVLCVEFEPDAVAAEYYASFGMEQPGSEIVVRIEDVTIPLAVVDSNLEGVSIEIVSGPPLSNLLIAKVTDSTEYSAFTAVDTKHRRRASL